MVFRGFLANESCGHACRVPSAVSVFWTPSKPNSTVVRGNELSQLIGDCLFCYEAEHLQSSYDHHCGVDFVQLVCPGEKTKGV